VWFIWSVVRSSGMERSRRTSWRPGGTGNTRPPSSRPSRSSEVAGTARLEVDEVIPRTKSVAKGKVIFAEGEPAPGLWVVLAGRVRLVRISPRGREHRSTWSRWALR
jgi:hypothetical protein